MSKPTVSNADVSKKYPGSRLNELNALLDLANLSPGTVCLDLQAADGYVSDQIQRRLKGSVTTLCVEPVEAFHSRISSTHQIISDSIESLHSVKSESVDNVVGLAGLHHSSDFQQTTMEAYRVLKPKGFFTVADVEDETAMALWLNEVVDHYSRHGHKGQFLQSGQCQSLLKEVGFTNVVEEKKFVPWMFPSEEAMLDFLTGFFFIRYKNLSSKIGHSRIFVF